MRPFRIDMTVYPRILVALVLAVFALACDKDEPEKVHDNHQEHQHDHGDHEDSHRAKAPGETGTNQCEHDIAIIECDECRYEAGAVDVALDLLGNRGKGLISTRRIALSAFGGQISLTGEVAFDEGKVVHVGPRIKGVARKVFASLGDKVEAGSRLVEMDSLDLGRQRSSYRQASAKFDLARQIFEREKRLFEKRISSTNERLQAETAYLQAKIDLEASREQLSLLGFSEVAIEDLAVNPGSGRGRMTIRSPISGQVVAKHAVTGEQLSPDKEIFTIADLTTVWVWANLYETDLAPLLGPARPRSLPANVKVAAFPGRNFSGVVDYVGATMDETTRTIKVRIVVSNPELVLRPGMFADVSIDMGTSAQALRIPEEAVVDDEGEQFVFVKIGEKRFRRRDVQVGTIRAGMTEVLSGLAEGEEIVVKGAFLLKSDILREKMGAGCAD